MRIAINTRLLVKNKLDGIGYFAHEVLQRLVRNNPQHEFIFIFDRKYSQDFVYADNVQAISLFPQARHPILYFLWFHIVLPLWLRKNKPDLFFSPEGYLALGASLPQVNVIHDLNFEHQPKDLPLAERWFYRAFFPKYARAAKKIITVSDFSKKDIVDRYNIAESKISRIHLGIRDIFSVSNSESSFRRHENYFLSVGTIHARKNIEGLIAAFNKFKKEDTEDYKLLIAGRKKWWSDSIKSAFENSPYKSDIKFIGRLSSEDLVSAYQQATALCNLSHFEGFGLPLIEAMACACPVLCSNIPAFKEVGEGSCLLVDKDNSNEIAEAMKKVSQNSDFRNRLIAKGLSRSKDFSWDLAAKKVEEIIFSNAKA